MDYTGKKKGSGWGGGGGLNQSATKLYGAAVFLELMFAPKYRRIGFRHQKSRIKGLT